MGSTVGQTEEDKTVVDSQGNMKNQSQDAKSVSWSEFTSTSTSDAVQNQELSENKAVESAEETSNGHMLELALEESAGTTRKELENNSVRITQKVLPAATLPAPVTVKPAAPRVSYVYCQELVKLCDKMLRIPDRASIVQSLIWAYGLPRYMDIIPGRVATEAELLGFHSLAYIEFLRNVKQEEEEDEDDDVNNDGAEMFGLKYDCPVQEGMYDCSVLVAGASIAAAEALVEDKCDVAINWFGGWHHAQRESASGFCYINDAVLSILKLREKFQRVLYVDLDLHHGDGVEEAFCTTPKVMTVSFHKHGPGFFPGTGSCLSTGYGKGRYYAVNVPFEDGTGNVEYVMMFHRVMKLVYEAFKPSAVVCQCGADGLAGDPMEVFNLTPLALTQCVGLLLSWKLPTLLLGGGGYNPVNCAKCWAQLTALAVGKKLPEDIPDHKYYTDYGPDFELRMSEGNRRSLNARIEMERTIHRIFVNMQHIRT